MSPDPASTPSLNENATECLRLPCAQLAFRHYSFLTESEKPNASDTLPCSFEFFDLFANCWPETCQSAFGKRLRLSCKVATDYPSLHLWSSMDNRYTTPRLTHNILKFIHIFLKRIFLWITRVSPVGVRRMTRSYTGRAGYAILVRRHQPENAGGL